jgi:hypothetical protein
VTLGLCRGALGTATESLKLSRPLKLPIHRHLFTVEMKRSVSRQRNCADLST